MPGSDLGTEDIEVSKVNVFLSWQNLKSSKRDQHWANNCIIKNY